MRRSAIRLALALAFGAGAAACTGESGGGEKETQREAPPAATKKVDPATAGTIEGTVSFSGAPPENPELAITEPACADVRAGPVRQDQVLVRDGKLENAFVYIKEGLADYAFEPSDREVVIDQAGCIYRPLVVGVQVGQQLTFVNSDPVLHNVHIRADQNPGSNFSMPVRGARSSRKFNKPEVMIRTKCDVHPWMRAFIGVLPHPYFAVTGPDGTFHFPGVPPGAYVIELWHEKLGVQRQNVTLAEKGTARVDFQLGR